MLDEVVVRFRGQFAYLDAHLPDGEIMPLCLYLNNPTAWQADTPAK